MYKFLKNQLVSTIIVDIFILVVILITSLPCSSDACEFPQSMQSNVTSHAGGASRDWRGRIKSQFTEFTLRMEIGRNVLSVVSTGNGEVPSHSRACVRALSGGRYIVAHEETGQVGNKFTCVQFIHRSPDVVQVSRSSDV